MSDMFEKRRSLNRWFQRNVAVALPQPKPASSLNDRSSRPAYSATKKRLLLLCLQFAFALTSKKYTRLSSLAARRKRSAYERRAETMNELFSFRIGPASIMRLAMDPMPPVPSYSRLFPSFVLTSSIDERRPPNRAGIPPL